MRLRSGFDTSSPELPREFGAPRLYRRAAFNISRRYLRLCNCQRAIILIRGEPNDTVCRSAAALASDKKLVGVPGFEPGTSSLSGTRSNLLSYTPGNRSEPGTTPRTLIPCPSGPVISHGPLPLRAPLALPV